MFAPVFVLQAVSFPMYFAKCRRITTACIRDGCDAQLEYAYVHSLLDVHSHV